MNIWRINIFARLGIVLFISCSILLFSEIIVSLTTKLDTTAHLYHEFLVWLSCNVLFYLLLTAFLRKHILPPLHQIDNRLQLCLESNNNARKQNLDWPYILPSIHNGLDNIEAKIQQLANIETRYKSILDMQAELVFMVDENGFLTYYNRAFCIFMKITEHHKTSFINDDFTLDDTISLIINSCQEDVLNLARKNVTGHQFTGDIAINNKTHSINWIVKHTGDTKDEDYNGSFLFAGRDSTQEKVMMECNQKLENLATVGRLAISISHEINQPLSIISITSHNLTDMGKNGLLDAEMIKRKTVKIVQQVDRIDKIIKDLKAFNRGQASFKPFNLKSTITYITNNHLDSLTRHNIRLIPELTDKEITLNGPKTLFQQVLHNIVDNSTYELIKSKTEQPAIRIKSSWNQSSSEVILQLSDNGGGAPEEAMPYLLDPFFSTKPPGIGTGIGLALCFDVIQKMGGTLECRNTCDGFAVFITLPCVAEKAVGKPNTAPCP